MRIERVALPEHLFALADGWNQLAANPFCSWDWMDSWWRHYGGEAAPGGRPAELCTLCVYGTAGPLAGVAPWYLTRSLSQGRVLRLLGSGEVCSDYLTIPCLGGLEDEAAEALARWLTPGQEPSANGWDAHRPPRWDLLELSGTTPQDPVITRLAAHLAKRGCTVHTRPEANSWRIELPVDWDAYLGTLSKSHRRQLRRLQRRYFDNGRAVLRTVENAEDLDPAWRLLVNLHQRRSQSLGRPGCFASPSFAEFHRQAAWRMFQSGRLRLHWLELDGRPIAADYHLAQAGVIYAYQGGIDPDALDHEPGRLMTMASLQQAIRQGCRAFDFLRGDEPYKAHFRAAPRPLVQLRIGSGRAAARLRYAVRSAVAQAKGWLAGGP